MIEIKVYINKFLYIRFNLSEALINYGGVLEPH